MKLWVLVSVVLVSGCATTKEVWGGRTPTRETRAVQSAAVRYFAEHYEPSEFLGEPEAYCLVLGLPGGNRAARAMEISARNERWDPPPAVVATLRRVTPRIVPISSCVWGEDLSEVLRESGKRAVALGIGYPTWVTPDLARFVVHLRENQIKRFSFGCSAVRSPEGWAIRECV